MCLSLKIINHKYLSYEVLCKQKCTITQVNIKKLVKLPENKLVINGGFAYLNSFII